MQIHSCCPPHWNAFSAETWFPRTWNSRDGSQAPPRERTELLLPRARNQSVSS